jgi:iron complex transport system ATP-binding protein
MTAYLTIQNGTFSYGEKSIFSGLTLEVYKDEVTCILGANGCGKTTLLRCLNGSMRLQKGKVLLGETDIALMQIDEIAKKVGFVFQEHTALFPFSVLEVVRMGRAPHLKLFATPSRCDTQIALEKLEMVGMLHLKDKPYTQISGGERQLILIARTLAQEPEVILMDEPTSHLDFRNQTIVLQIVNKLAENGLGILMTSHLPDHALLFSSRVALMKGGHFVAIGEPNSVMTEERLKEIYGIDVRMVNLTDPYSYEMVKLVLPKRNSRKIQKDGSRKE